MKWVTDPITKTPSVALTMVLVACLLMVGGIILECFTAVRSTHLLDEFFGAAIALYGSHMVTFKDCLKDTKTTEIVSEDIRPQ